MILILDGASQEQLAIITSRLRDELGATYAEYSAKFPIHLYNSVKPVEGRQIIFGSYPERSGNLAEDRLRDLYLASQGVRYWGDKIDDLHATYAGKLPETPEQYDQLIADVAYTETRRKYIESFGVAFTGSVYVSPKSFIIVDHKRGTDSHNSIENYPKVANLIASVPADFWGNTAIISTQSAKKLEIILEEHDQTVPITTSTKTSAKLKFAGLNAIDISLPSEPSREVGIMLRASVTLFERQ